MWSGFSSSRAYLPLLVLPVLLVALSSEKVAVSPIWWVALLAVGLVTLRTLSADRPAGWIDYLCAGLLGVAATHRLLTPGFPHGHDIITHLWGTYGFFRAILEGNFLPRWIHQLGLGMPFLLFYPPLPFYLMLPFQAMGLPVYDAFKGGFVLYSVLSGWSMAFVMSRLTGSRRVALLAAGAYVYAPYHLLQSQYRVSVAEAAAMVVLPLFIWAVFEALEAPSGKRLGLAIVSGALLTLTHPLSLSMAGTALGLFVLGRHRFRWSPVLRRSLLWLLAIGVLGVCLAGYYTVPIAAESRYSTIASALGSKKSPMYTQHGLTPDQLVERREWHKWQKSESRGSKESSNEMPFYFGLTLLVLLPLARGKTASQQAAVSGLRVLTGGALVLSLTPLDWMLGFLPPMSMLQFSWRFLALATVGASMLAGFALLRILEDLGERRVAMGVTGLLFAVLVWDCYPYTGAARWVKPYTGLYRMEVPAGRELPLRVDHLDFPPSDPAVNLSAFRRVYPEYFTRAVRDGFYKAKEEEEKLALIRGSVGVTFEGSRKGTWLDATPYAEFTPEGGGAAVALPFTRGGERIEVTPPGQAGMLVVKEQAFPGWELHAGGSTLGIETTQDGLMQVQLEAVDKDPLVFTFSRTRWDRTLGIVLSALTGLLVVWLWRRPEGTVPLLGGPTPERDQEA